MTAALLPSRPMLYKSIMSLEELVTLARAAGASDVHLESTGKAVWRVNGTLRCFDDAQAARAIEAIVTNLLDEAERRQFEERRSVDCAVTIASGRCRLNVFYTNTSRAAAIRLLPQAVPAVAELNLHPAFAELPRLQHGLVIVSGPTGSGKSSTLAALVNGINRSSARHIVTLESPVEFMLASEQSFVQQREVGRDTPSFEQGLIDALRQDPDVIVVGEMREPETMRLVLNAAETGHLVMTTLHSGSSAEALQRIVGAFPAEIQGNVAAQLADVVQAVIAQRLHWCPGPKLRIPVCEMLRANHAVRNHVRSRDFFKLASALEVGSEEGMFTFERYRRWVDGQSEWHAPATTPPGIVPSERPTAGRTGNPEEQSRIEIDPFRGSLGAILKKN